GLLIDQLSANFSLDLAERHDARYFVLLELDDMDAMAGANRRSNFAWLQRLYRGKDRVVDVGGREPSEFTAVGFRVVVGIDAREIAEVGALGRARSNRIGLLL